MLETKDARLASAALHFIRPVLLKAGRLALASRNELVETHIKADETPVTKLDYDIEALLVKQICREYPHHRILAEEGSIVNSDSEYTWAIDPLDGTRAYVSGLPIWGISVGLLRNEEPLAGVFYLPALNEMYECDGQSAFLNGRPLMPSGASLNSRHAFLAVPSNSHLLYEIRFDRVRSFGSTAAHLVYVARGAAIGALTRQVRLWDLVGVMPMMLCFGIELRYLSGAPFHVNDLLDGQRAPEPILAARSDLIHPLLSMIRLKPSTHQSID